MAELEQIQTIPPLDKYAIPTCQHTFGTATKPRSSEPSMFQLLSWENAGFDQHSFKKREKFESPSEAYMNMIGKAEWVSESKENYQTPALSIQADPERYEQIEGYINERVSKGDKSNGLKKKRKPQKEPMEKTESVVYNPKKYHSTKPGSTTTGDKQIMNAKEFQGKSAPKQARSASADLGRSSHTAKNGQRGSQMLNNSNIKRKERELSIRKEGQNFERNRVEQGENSDLTEQQQGKLIQKFKQTTRWIPNSSFTTYFGRPPFENYGRGNTQPTHGGLIYGTYMYSHNVHPHRGSNQPRNMQSYPVALSKAQSQGTLTPCQPRSLPQEVINRDSRSGPIVPERNGAGQLTIEVPDLRQVPKFGGRRVVRGH